MNSCKNRRPAFRTPPAAEANNPRHLPSRRRRAFSLVEVVLALGIISAVFIPLLGMLSVGFTTMKESAVDMKASLIAQKVLASAQMAPYDMLQNATKYLDYEGIEVPQQDAIFTAVITLGTSGNFLGSPNLKNIKVSLTGAGIPTNTPRVFSTAVVNIGD